MNEDSQKLIGKILDEDGPTIRDAVHIAFITLVAGEILYAREHVDLAWGSKTIAIRGNPGIGIVDPFLDVDVQEHQRFLCFLTPGTATGLTHHYKHPALDGPLPVAANESEEWLRQFASEWHFNYNEMIAGALRKGGYTVAVGIDLHSADELETGDEKLFWYHIQKLTGKKVSKKQQKAFGWSCSC